ncbi:MAG: PAS domain-containing protein [Acidimicrobiia bacterium]|nr:PAS domain-containing protein [Acidimicrobiia bacterium]
MATQYPIELILARQLADSMSHPVWITDAAGNLVFYNEPGEAILGVRFDDAGKMPATELAERFATQELDGSELLAEDLPIVVALTEWIPAHRRIRIRAYDGIWRKIGVTAIPLVGQGERRVGVLVTFWELED